MMKRIVPLFVMSCSIFAANVEVEGNTSLQYKQVWNNSQAQAYQQNWKSPQNVREVNGNIKGKFSHERHSANANLYYRFNQTDLYQGNYLINDFINFPGTFVSRSAVDMEHTSRSANSQSQYLFNQMSYQYEGDKYRFEVGRHLINYGLGEIFNPINPFAFPAGLVMMNNFVQGNDGASINYQFNDLVNLTYSNLYSKNLTTGELMPTHWFQASARTNSGLEAMLVGGQDQKHKQLGVQVNWQGDQALFYVQAVRRFGLGPTRVNLWDLALGIDEQITELWHSRIECGYQQQGPQTLSFNSDNRFLPMETFCAFANSYEPHPLLKLSLTATYDPKYQFFLGLFKAIYRFSDNYELSFNLNAPWRGKEQSTFLAQKFVPTMAGISLDAYF